QAALRRYHHQIRRKGVGIVNTGMLLARGVEKHRNARVLQRVENSVNRLPVPVQRLQQDRLSRRKTIPGRIIAQPRSPVAVPSRGSGRISERWRRVYLGDGSKLTDGRLDVNGERASAGRQ